MMDSNPHSAEYLPDWSSEGWIDPVEERNRLRLRLQRFWLGFLLLGLALLVASISSVGGLILIFTGQRLGLGALFEIPHFELIESAMVTWGSFLGVCLLCGPWPDVNWQRRSGILMMMCLLDVVLWSLDHAGEIGLYDGSIGHDWFRRSVGTAVGWSEFALIVSLAADISNHLGEPRALELSRSVRSMATTGAMMWFLWFALRTDWRPPIWPLRERMGLFLWNVLLYLSWIVMGTICFVQSTGLSLLAGHRCSLKLREMAAVDKANDVMPSRSEDGWDDMIRQSGPKGDA